MNKINQILAALGDELSTQTQKSELSSNEILEKIPFRSLSGDHIYGGKVINFASNGIVDKATTPQLTLSDQGVAVETFSQGFTVNGNIQAEDAKFKVLKADVIEAANIIGEIKFEKDSNVSFNGDNKGLIWTGLKTTKQFIFAVEPDRFFSSETIDVVKGKSFSINGIKIIDDQELGSTVIKSNLREVGRLRGLIVDGSISINNYLYYNASSDRLGLGTEQPNASFSVAEDAIEVMLGTRDSVRGIAGTFASHAFDLVTDNTTRIGIAANGNIQLGNTKNPPIQVSIHGKLAVKVNMPDPEVDLHVNGAIKFNGKLHKYAATHPVAGAYNAGDIVWNTEPKVNNFVGWVCVQAGDPGIWAPFGKIGT